MCLCVGVCVSVGVCVCVCVRERQTLICVPGPLTLETWCFVLESVCMSASNSKDVS